MEGLTSKLSRLNFYIIFLLEQTLLINQSINTQMIHILFDCFIYVKQCFGFSKCLIYGCSYNNDNNY